MAKSDPIEHALDRLGELRHADPSAEVVDELREFLRSRSNIVIAKAAKVARELRLTILLTEIVAAFDKLTTNAPKLDKRCAALTELMSALYELDYDEPPPYLWGLKHMQLEASYGPPVDEAAKLRALSAQGLLRTRYPDAIAEVVPLLVDPEPAARAGAIRALAVNGGECGVLLLRLKVGECFTALLSGSGEKAVPFVSRYVDSEDDAVSEAAILALGESRLPAAYEVLKEKWERTVVASGRKVLLAAIAASRLDGAIAFLISLVESASLQTAGDAMEALSVYRHNDRVSKAVLAVIEARGDKVLRQRFSSDFERSD
jgi:HEAT repeat protein